MEHPVPDYVHAAMAEKLAAERDHFAALADMNQALARRENALADEAEIRAREQAFKESLRDAGNIHHGVVYYPESVSSTSVEACIGHIDYLHRTKPGEEIEIVFTSPGGDVVAGMRLFDHIRMVSDLGTPITIGTRGMAASMAGILLQAGDTRYMGREAWVLIHQISAGVQGSYGDIQDRVKWFERMQERILDVFAKRCKQAGENGTASSPATRRQLEKGWNRTDWWLSSDECLKLGIVDEVR